MAKIIKGEERGRPGKWLVDWRDHAGVRHNKTFDTKREAEDFYADVLKTQDVRATPAVSINISVSDYAVHWLASIRGGVKPATMASYQAQFARYINPALGTVRVRTLQRHHIKVFYVKLRESLSKASVKLRFTSEACACPATPKVNPIAAARPIKYDFVITLSAITNKM